MTTAPIKSKVGEQSYHNVIAASLLAGDILFQRNLDNSGELILRGIVQTVSKARGGTVNPEINTLDEPLPMPLVCVLFYNPSTLKTTTAYFNVDESFSIIRPAKEQRPAYK